MLRRVRTGRDDAGTTLSEVLVSMVLMSFFMAIFTPAVLHIYNWTRRTEAVTTSQTMLRIAMQRLDTEVRYASSINSPRLASSGDRYVEYRTDATTTGTVTCARLRLTAGGVLQRILWTEGGWSASQPWSQLATGVASASTQPFEVTAPIGGPDKLRVRLTVTQGGSATAAASGFDYTFTALNSIDPYDSGSAAAGCTEGRPS